jgi:DNA-binding MarR family transcriptional regulator
MATSTRRASAARTFYDPKTFEPGRCVGRLLTQVKMAMSDALDEQLAPLDITAAQFVILVTLAAADDGSSSHLCKSVSYDQGAMTRMIDRLERKGLVKRVRSPDDRRKVNLELTAQGRAAYPKLIASAAAVNNRFLRGFTKIEARKLEALLERLLANR